MKRVVMPIRTEARPNSLSGTPAGGYRVVGDIVATNMLRFSPDNVIDVAIKILASHSDGRPVVGLKNECFRFIDEGNVIRAFERGVDLQCVTAESIMNTAFIGVTDEATLPLSPVCLYWVSGLYRS